MAKHRRQRTSRSTVLSLKVGGEDLKIAVETKSGSTKPIRMLPVFRSVCGTIVDWTVARIERERRSISCKAGCGACCRQMVPISKTEARRLAEVVAEMPDERRRQVEERFADAVEHFGSVGLLEATTASQPPIGSAYKDLGLRYFEQGIACPFLEDESCSIHRERPLVCREYLVVSDPENCSRKNGRPIEVLKLPLEPSKALTAINSNSTDFVDWVPLVFALKWVKENPDDSILQNESDIVRVFLEKLTGFELPVER